MIKPVYIGCNKRGLHIVKAFEFLITKAKNYEGSNVICLTNKRRGFFADPEFYKDNPSYKYVSVEEFLRLITLDKESFERNFRE
jgi:hypothetical protein